MTTGLAAVLWKWLGRHEQCLARQVGVASFDVITTVPSTSRRQDRPLAGLVSGVVSGSGQRYEDVLVMNRTDLGRSQTADRYRATRQLAGQTVLVIDDTWTSGAHAQSAAAALKVARAGGVGVVAIGRWFNPAFGDGARWLAEQRRQAWEWSRCCLEGT